MKQGKCDECKKRFVWPKDLASRFCGCPICGQELRQTSYQLEKYPTIEIEKPAQIIEPKTKMPF